MGLHPTLIIRNQYLNPHVKSAIYAVAIAIFGFACFIGGAVHQMIPNTETVFVSLNLPENTSLHNVEYGPIYAIDNDDALAYTKLTSFYWNPSAEDYIKEIDCLAKNIYFEARNEKLLGKLAVGLVTINRLLDPEFPETICDVVWQKRRHPNTKKWVAQFSWTWDGKKDKPLNQEKWDDALALAWVLLDEKTLHNIVDFTEGSIYYHADYVKPWWSEKLIQQGFGYKQIGTHILFTPRGQDVFAVAENDSR